MLAQVPGQLAGIAHECCLGLAHAPTLAEPLDAAFLFVEHVNKTIALAANDEALAPVGIHDAPADHAVHSLMSDVWTRDVPLSRAGEVDENGQCHSLPGVGRVLTTS